METIYDILKAEHRQVADLTQQAMRDSSKESFLKIKAKLDPHMMGEEKLFYPLLEQKSELCELVNHAYEEHNEIRSVSSELESMDPSSSNWVSKLKELDETVSHHVEEEENKVFPEAQRVMSEDKAQQIAQQYLDFSKTFKQQHPMP
ncbi:hemerythrin [Methanosarcina thermophila MST-A1]|uniref:hemerythrin domain-containing protein n=1 Tax=Methanosarcina thermophila TaxID=2210 RepID=UPI0016A9722D|nr:hemerythrin domain-containing protein [Methanosarcina thermophila]NLU56504.1 hemerythrin domain-containing protein [Methanosarcina thermophila]GLI14423.1 hemerythrin [Methanosarcina thermophila MST-A1]